MSTDYITTDTTTLYRRDVTRWLRDQPTVEMTTTADGMCAVDLTHGWAVLAASAHGHGPHVRVMVADLERALGMARSRIIKGIEQGQTIMQMQYAQDQQTADDARERFHGRQQ